MKPRLLDYFAFIISIGFIVLFTAFTCQSHTHTLEVYITCPTSEWFYPINQDRIVQVKGHLGISIVEIKKGKVRMLDSPCLNKLCIKSGSISSPGGWIACMPNHVIIQIRGKHEEPIDATSF